MTRWSAGLSMVGLLSIIGCVTTDTPLTAVPGSVFGFAPTPTSDTKVSYAAPRLGGGCAC